MVRHVSQEIVPNHAPRRHHTRTAPPPPPPPQKRVRTVQPNALEKDLKGLSLPGENFGDSSQNVLTKCCERAVKVLRKTSDSDAKHRRVL